MLETELNWTDNNPSNEEKYINKHIGKYVTFYTGNGKAFDYSPDKDKKIVMPGVEDKRNEVKDSASTLEGNLKKLAK